MEEDMEKIIVVNSERVAEEEFSREESESSMKVQNVLFF